MADGWKKAADLRRKVAQDEWKSATRVCLPAIFIFVCDLQHFEITLILFSIAYHPWLIPRFGGSIHFLKPLHFFLNNDVLNFF